ncbi:hypothetical protein M422DRAFT_48981 [Sphaerobolus stellatus SS14]|uniref:Uncharacterized protein n=1 Tax=Sphaerobolus stellatus (strain SS14) TaxID=990650 RepID=A0A0C9VHU5_SPHS4|nr:hypothetical protein M422DRAFT_48981 [Sphaerobolus stellatus SS14]
MKHELNFTQLFLPCPTKGEVALEKIFEGFGAGAALFLTLAIGTLGLMWLVQKCLDRTVKSRKEDHIIVNEPIPEELYSETATRDSDLELQRLLSAKGKREDERRDSVSTARSDIYISGKEMEE